MKNDNSINNNIEESKSSADIVKEPWDISSQNCLNGSTITVIIKELSRISWEIVKEYYRSTCKKAGASPAAVAVIQTFGDFLSFNPHIHILAADGFFYAPGINIDTESIEKLFIHKIFKMLLSKNLITSSTVDLIHSWRHTGFSVYCGKRIYPKDKRSTENLARYIIRGVIFARKDEILPG